MGPLLRRIRPRRDATPAAADGDTLALPEVGEPTPEASADARPLPAGVAPEELIGDRPDTRRRGRLRRRLRHLRQVRELVLRDVGGLLYEVHRGGDEARAREHGMSLVQAKLERLSALDAERLELEAILSDRRAETVVREPGVGGACPACGEYFASDAHFCANCGARVDGGVPAATTPPADTHATTPAGPGSDAATPAAEPAPSEPPARVRG